MGCSHNNSVKECVNFFEINKGQKELLSRFRKEPHSNPLETFKLVRGISAKFQIAYSTNEKILSKGCVEILYGPPHFVDENENWIYYFDPNKSLSVRLEFRNNELFYTGFEMTY